MHISLRYLQTCQHTVKETSSVTLGSMLAFRLGLLICQIQVKVFSIVRQDTEFREKVIFQDL